MKKILKLFIMLCPLMILCIIPCSTPAKADTARDDSAYIQGLIDNAVAGSNGIKVVTVPHINPNDPKGGSVYTLSNAIELESDTTVKLDNCTLKLNDSVLCNIFISKGCYNSSMTSSQELKNISIIGIGNAILDGGTHNGITEKTATMQDGFSTVRRNISIHFRNVNGFNISDITIKESRYWGITFIYCRNGTVSNIRFDDSNDAPNQDGIDLRIGCNNIEVSDITGAAGDDVVALTALDIASDLAFHVQGKDNDIHDVSITNVTATSVGEHGIVRLLCHHGNKVYNVDIKNIEDTGTNHVQGVIRIGDNNYAGTGSAMKYGDIHSVTVDGVISNGKVAIHAPNINVTTAHVTYRNITVKYTSGILTNLTDDTLDILPLTPLSGCAIYAFEGGSKDGWTYNNNGDIRTSNGKMNGTSDSYTMWPIGPTRLDAGEYLELTTAIDGDTSVYEHFRLQLVMAHISGTDPEPGLMKIYYSTDNGVTWSEEPIDLTLAFHGDLWVASASSKYNVWSFTSGDLSALTDKRITNLMLHPYGEDGSITVGAFRLISLYVAGDHPTEHYEMVPATCKSSGAKEHWLCTACGVKFENEACSILLNGLSIPYDKVNGHDLIAVDRRDPTETETGLEAHFKCNRCGTLYLDADNKTSVSLEEITIPVVSSPPADDGEGGGAEQPESNEQPSDDRQQNGNLEDNNDSENDGDNNGIITAIIIIGASIVVAASVVIFLIRKRKH